MGITVAGHHTRPIEPAESSADALFPKVRQSVLRLLFLHSDERFLQKDIITKIQLGSGGVQRELGRLSKAGILNRTAESRQIYYQANPSNPVFAELQGLVRKTLGIATVLRDALKPIADQIQFAVLFGSIAAGTEKASSDVDLMIVSDSVSLGDILPAIQAAERTLSREVNPAIYPTKEFRLKVSRGHNFLTNVLNGPTIMLIGSEHELTRLGKKRVASSPHNHQARNR
jgi:predicted nucleotidyltransferase